MSENPLFSKGPNRAFPADFRLPSGFQKLNLDLPILTMGSPGSGKTTLLRHLAMAKVKEFGPQSVLVLTPSRTSATVLRDQLITDSQAVSRGPIARSLSSLAYWVLEQTNKQQNLAGPRLLSGANQQELIKQLIDQALKSGLSSNWGIPKAALGLQGFASEMRDLITVLLEHEISQSALAELQSAYPKLRLGAALDIYPQYLEALDNEDLLDTSLLLVRANQLLTKNPELLSEIRYVLVDDAQELTASALALLSNLSKRQTIYLFADPDATVLGFRGAVGAKLISKVTEFLPQIQKLILETEHSVRTEEISELLRKTSNRIPVALSGMQRKNLNSNASDSDSVAAKVFPNSIQELDFVATEIRKLRVSQEVDWDSFVVVARTRPQLDAIQKGLVSRSVPCRIVGSQTAIRDQYAARSILNLALQILEPENQDIDVIKSLLQSPFCGLDSIGIRRLLRRLSFLERESGLNRTLKQVLEEVIEVATPELEGAEFKKLRKLQNLVRSIRQKAPSNGYELVSEIWKASDLPERWLEFSRGSSEVAAAASRDLDSVLELFAAAQRFYQRNPHLSAADFVKYQLAIAVPEDSLAPIGFSPAVTLATPSALIGQRFDYGFLPRLQDGIWPNLKARSSLLGATAIDEYLKGNSDSPEKLTRIELSEELRLLYKALGAISKKVFLTAMSSNEEQPSPIFNILFSKPPEVETFERDFDLRHRVGRLRARVQRGDTSAALELATLAKLSVPGADPASWFGYLGISSETPLAESAELVTVNPSKLEAFEKCPLHWFISAHGGDGSGFEASLGTLIHEALEKAKDDSAQLAPIVDSLWHQLEFEADWQEQAQKRKAIEMVQALTEYIQTKSGELVAAEAAFEFIVGRLKISGKVDRIERTESGLVVADLKTGKVGTKEEVAHNKQLALYQLATKEVLQPNQSVAGAKIISVGQKLSVPTQGPLEGELLSELQNLLTRAATEMSKTEMTAVVSDHCDGNADCSLLLVRQVTQIV